MKFTSEDLMKAMGLQVGDKVRTKDNFTFEVCKNNLYFLKGINIPENKGLEFLIDLEVDVLPRPKRVGDRICDQFCAGCPLVVLQCFSEEKEKKSLFLVLDETLNRHTDQEIYDILKARLDKEVKDNVD